MVEKIEIRATLSFSEKEVEMQQAIGFVISLFLVIAVQTASPALGADEETLRAAKTRLFDRLASASTEAEGRAVEFEIWEFWTAQAPDEKIGATLKRGMEKRREFDLPWAEDLMDEVVDAAPGYAEGWNQRAFIRFLRDRPDAALGDLEKAIELEPLHFGALSGMYHVLRLQNRHAAAMKVLQRAVAIHPWLKERGALPEDMWPENFRRIHQPGLKL